MAWPARPGVSVRAARRERARRSARGGAARVLCDGDVTGARDAVRGRERRGLTGVWTVAWPTSWYRQ
jgi:hypothetical protein